MVTRNLWSARVWVRDWLCKEKTHHPQCTLPKVSCIVVWLFFFLSRVSIRWSFLRFKADLFSWESLYLNGLNPNRSKVWILARVKKNSKHFQTLERLGLESLKGWTCMIQYGQQKYVWSQMWLSQKNFMFLNSSNTLEHNAL